MEKREIAKLVAQMTVEEKAKMITGSGPMETNGVERLNIPVKKMADATCGIRGEREENHTMFPSISSLAASWDCDLAKKMGEALGVECKEYGIDMLLAPGINIKRHILCGRNFEYFSEDPILAGEMAAAYVNGLQEKGVAASLKHFAGNSQEKYRTQISVEADERTLRELYLKAFEIVVKKSNPVSIMCAYNKIDAVWCSENKKLLTDILRDEWGYEGFVVSDWGAVHDICRSLSAGLDLQMPGDPNIVEKIENGLANHYLTEETLNRAAERVTAFALAEPLGQEKTQETPVFDRNVQHETAGEIEKNGITLLKNRNQVLPLRADKYKKIAVLGEYASSPLRCGQGAAEVYPLPEYMDNPLDELRKCMPQTEFCYMEGFSKTSYSEQMLWPQMKKVAEFVKDADAVLVFAGSMTSEDTEKFDRRTARLNANFEMFIEEASAHNPNVIVVLQSGSALILDDWHKNVSGIVEMWLGGEAGGKAIAEVLCGKHNPCGKLAETFPNTERRDLNYPGNGRYVEYSEKLNVGYRYYDKHPEEICYPFGHGLSYTEFGYSNLQLTVNQENVMISFEIQNTGDYDGSEIAQIYIGNPDSIVSRPIKELKAFEKLFLQKGERKAVSVTIPLEEIGYYNSVLKTWVTENGQYRVSVGSSSQDIRLSGSFLVKQEREAYTRQQIGQDQIG